MGLTKLNKYASDLVHLLSKSGVFTYKKWVLTLSMLPKTVELLHIYIHHNMFLHLWSKLLSSKKFNFEKYVQIGQKKIPIEKHRQYFA